MKTITLVWSVCIAWATSSAIALEAMAATQAGAASTQAAAVRHKATGIVKKVDAKAGTATIEHGPVASLKWAGMTMPFAVKDPAVLAKMEVGRKIEFEIEQRGTEFIIVRAR